jgi:hypothetical protein
MVLEDSIESSLCECFCCPCRSWQEQLVEVFLSDVLTRAQAGVQDYWQGPPGCIQVEEHDQEPGQSDKLKQESKPSFQSQSPYSKVKEMGSGSEP